MKKVILMVLMTFAIILGMSAQNKPAKPVVMGGANTYPHSTGYCTCGEYASCHPRTINTDEDARGNIYFPPHRPR